MIKDNMTDSSNDMVMNIINNNKIELNGILAKVVTSLIRTHAIKKTLNIRQNGMNTVAKNLDEVVKLYELNGKIMSKSDYISSHKSVIFGDILPMNHELNIKFNELISDGSILVVNC